MPNKFTCSYVRHYGELEDEHTVDLYADNVEDAFCLLYADLSDLYATSAKQAIAEARSQLASHLGQYWTTKDFIKTNFEIWPDTARCFEILDVSESDV